MPVKAGATVAPATGLPSGSSTWPVIFTAGSSVIVTGPFRARGRTPDLSKFRCQPGPPSVPAEPAGGSTRCDCSDHHRAYPGASTWKLNRPGNMSATVDHAVLVRSPLDARVLPVPETHAGDRLAGETVDDLRAERHARLKANIEPLGLVGSSAVAVQPRDADARDADLDIVDVGLGIHPVMARLHRFSPRSRSR